MTETSRADKVVGTPSAQRGHARTSVTARRPGTAGRWVRRHWLDVAMVAPLVLYVLFFMLVPVGQSIYFSFLHAGTSDFTLADMTTSSIAASSKIPSSTHSALPSSASRWRWSPASLSP